MKPSFFQSSAEFREWLVKNHNKAAELIVELYKKDSGRRSITYSEALDEVLCFGWIDGVRRRIDEFSYSIRFSPRKPRSIWSRVNIKRAAELEKQGRMHVAGLKAFHGRNEALTRKYSYERKTSTLGPAYQKQFKANEQAWEFFQSQPPGYQRTATWWVISAKQEKTRLRRLQALISDSAQGRRLGVITLTAKGKDPAV
jgi:uncharacterized protein YdeI (YjbR/CyaY-like superfamily)